MPGGRRSRSSTSARWHRGPTWALLTSGMTATRGITLFDPAGFRSRIAAECDFDPAAEGLTAEETQRTDRCSQFALVCAREALADSKLDLDNVPPGRIGVSIGSAVGNTITLEQQYVVVSDMGKRWVVDPAKAQRHLYRALIPSTIAAEVAWDCGAEGPAGVTSTGCTSGLDAVAEGAEMIEDGRADVVIAGATDAPISPITVACFDAIKATSPSAGTGSCSARAPRSLFSSRPTRHGAAARTSTARSRATPSAAMRIT